MQQSQRVVAAGHRVEFSASSPAAATASSLLISAAAPSPFSSLIQQCGGIRRCRQVFQQQQMSRSDFRRRVRLNRSILAAAAAAQAEEWIFEPVGDGEWRHIGEQVSQPNTFELQSETATVGRVEGKADIVVAVPTVSGIHARLEKKNQTLLVTDLDSTNGTFVNNKRLRPGSVTTVLPGSSIIFGDEHLAQFKFSLVQQEPEAQIEPSSA